MGGFASINKIAGKALAKIPVIGDTQLDEKLISSGDKISKKNDRNRDKLLMEFSSIEMLEPHSLLRL